MIEEIVVGVGSVQNPNRLTCPRCSGSISQEGSGSFLYRRPSPVPELVVEINFTFDQYVCNGCGRKFAPWFTPAEIHTILRERCLQIGEKHQVDALRAVALWRAQFREFVRRQSEGQVPLSELHGTCPCKVGEFFGQVLEVMPTPWDDPFDQVGFKCIACGLGMFDKDQAQAVAARLDEQRAVSKKWRDHILAIA